jgi:hypothetical protein
MTLTQFLLVVTTGITQHREACPPHKRKDLEKLVKSMNGDEDKIREKIMEWWEEPVEVPEVWEDVNKKPPKKKPGFGGDRGGGSRGGGRTQGAGRGGRGNQGRGGGGGRGEGGRDRPGRGGRGGRGGAPVGPPLAHEEQAATAEQQGPAEVVKTDGEPVQQPEVGVPVPLSNAPFLKGAWGARAVAAAPPAAVSAAPAALVEQPRKAPPPKPADTVENILEIGIVTHHDPTPAGIDPPVEKPIKADVPRSGNVWATKGSAHLIQAEKPALPPAPIAPIAPKAAEPEPPAPVVVAAPQFEELTLETGLTSGLPPTTSAWGNQSAPEPALTPIEMPPPPQVIPMAEIPTPVSPIPVAAPQPPSPAKPMNVLNMGHWETGDGDDSQNLDFGFGSFGADNDGVDNAAAPAMESVSASAAAAGVSPARPPPGLSMGGMPPMPANAVLVHELENKLESASLGGPANKDQAAPIQDKGITSNLPSQPDHQMHNGAQAAVPMLPGQNYNQYGMPGMYNYGAGAAGNGFGGIHAPAGHMLAGGMVPNQPGKPLGQPNAGGPSGVSQGLYGSQPPSGPSSVNAGSDPSDNISAQPGMPPGMPGAIPYANPALYYGQHQFHMGQHPQGGIGYNYGYGAQFGGVAQGGFGYQQQGMMGQHGGYGGPNYDDQGQHHQANTHHSGGSGGYQKNSGGGYRGRNAHHNNNQYQNQNQYNPQQHGGYGGQPYGMGYQHDQYNQQRGGYGPGGMSDPYAMQQGSGNYQPGGMGGGFQDDDQHKGKKGAGHRGNNNSSLQQNFQQGPPQQLGGQQPFGLQGQGSESTPSTGAGGGGGGWSNQAQGGGWSGGAPSWQGS